MFIAMRSLPTAIMPSDSPFGLTYERVVLDLASIFHSHILEILGYGMYTTVYCVALYLTLSHGNSPCVGSAALITIIWILITIHTSIIWVYLDNTYIQHGETWEVKLQASYSFRFGELFPLSVTNAMVTLISILLADMTMIWRCWVLYGRRWYIVIIPGSSLVAGLVCYIWRTILYFKPLIRASNQAANLELSFMSATITTKIFCTTAIICRIAVVSGWRKSFKTFRGLMEILIESSIMYTATYMIRIGFQVHFSDEHEAWYLFARAVGFSVTGLTPTLIIARVAAGFTRPDDSWSHSTSLPHIGSTMRPFAECLHFTQPATLDAGAETRRKRSKSTMGGGNLKTEPGGLSKDA